MCPRLAGPFSQFKFDDLFVQQNIFFLYEPIHMVVSKEMVIESAPPGYLLQEIGQSVSLVKSTVQLILYRGGATVSDDVVYRPTRFVQRGPGGPVFLLAGQFLFPPGTVVHPVRRTAGIQPPAFLLEQGIVRLQNSPINVMAAGPTHRKKGLALDAVDLASQQVEYRGTNTLHFSPAPLLHRILSQQVKVFVVPGDKQGRKGPCLHPVQPALFFNTAVPYAAKITDDGVVLFSQFSLLIENFLFETGKIAMCVTLSRCKDYSDFIL